jgi:thiol:disulfide interchange protein
VFAELYNDKGSDEAQQRVRDLQKKFGSVALPLYLVLTPEGKEISRLTGTIRESQFLAFLEKAKRDFEKKK